jgi:hypothetical protein
VSFPNGYTPRENRVALNKILRDMGWFWEICPECSDDVEYHDGEPAQPDIGVCETLPGFYCACGWRDVRDMTPDPATEWKYQDERGNVR